MSDTFAINSIKNTTKAITKLRIFFFRYFIQSRFFFFFYPKLTLWWLIQPDLESQFIVRAQLGLSIQSDSSPCAGLQVVTKFSELSKDCYPQLVLNPNRSEIRPPKHLDYKCMPLKFRYLKSKFYRGLEDAKLNNQSLNLTTC